MSDLPSCIHPYSVGLPPDRSLAALDGLAGRLDLRTGSGNRVRFVAPIADGLGYEMRIWQQGAIETRADSWHDLYNVLVWLNFPRAKAAINARHVAALARQSGDRRDPERDALTHFDECGVIVVSRRPELLELLRGFRWRELFVDQRTAVERDMALVVFGHATLEQLQRPFRGLTAKAVLEPVAAAWFEQALPERLAELDRRLAAAIVAGRYARSRALQPLPVLGWPGVVPESADPAYYDDRWQFRAGRRPAV